MERALAWDAKLDDFFKEMIPDITGDLPFITLDVLESLDREESGAMTGEKISKVIKKNRTLVEKIVRYLAKLGIIEKCPDTGTCTLSKTNAELSRFLKIYKTPSGRLKVIEKILGF